MNPDADRSPIMYQDGESFVVCDRKNPCAWIRSDTVVAVSETGRVRTVTR